MLNPLYRSYLDSIRDFMQKPIGGRVLWVVFKAKNMLKQNIAAKPVEHHGYLQLTTMS